MLVIGKGLMKVDVVLRFLVSFFRVYFYIDSGCCASLYAIIL